MRVIDGYYDDASAPRPSGAPRPARVDAPVRPARGRGGPGHDRARAVRAGARRRHGARGVGGGGLIGGIAVVVRGRRAGGRGRARAVPVHGSAAARRASPSTCRSAASRPTPWARAGSGDIAFAVARDHVDRCVHGRRRRDPRRATSDLAGAPAAGRARRGGRAGRADDRRLPARARRAGRRRWCAAQRRPGAVDRLNSGRRRIDADDRPSSTALARSRCSRPLATRAGPLAVGHRVLQRRLPDAVRREHGLVDGRSARRPPSIRSPRLDAAYDGVRAIARSSSPRSPTPTGSRWAWPTRLRGRQMRRHGSPREPDRAPRLDPIEEVDSRSSGRSLPRSPAASRGATAPGVAETMAAFRRMLREGVGARFFAQRARRPARRVVRALRATATSRRSRTSNTLEEFRGRGVARNVVLRAVPRKPRGRGDVGVPVRRRRGLAQHLYARLGFDEVGHEPAVHALARGHGPTDAPRKSPSEP